MIKKLFILILTISFVRISAQDCPTDGRFTELNYFSNAEIDSVWDVQYGSALNNSDEMQNLYIDYYFPKNDLDEMDQRPFILLIHGGAFAFGDKSSLRLDCKELAKKGYVVGTMGYRLGNSPALSNQYKAAQDAFAALRYTAHFSETYKVNPEQFFVGGYSAGSMTAMNMAFYQQWEWNSWINNLEENLGSLHTSGNDYTDPYSLLGMYNNAGLTYPETIDPDEMIPTINFHGTLDPVVFIDYGPDGYIGTRPLHYLYEDNDKCSQMNVVPWAGHVVYMGNLEETEYRTQKISCFFRSVICGECQLHYTEEEETANCSEGLATEDISRESWTVFPNPFQDKIQISSIKENYRFSLYNSNAQLLQQGNDLENYELSHLPQGVYLLTIETESKSKTFQLVKE